MSIRLAWAPRQDRRGSGEREVGGRAGELQRQDLVSLVKEWPERIEGVFTEDRPEAPLSTESSQVEGLPPAIA